MQSSLWQSLEKRLGQIQTKFKEKFASCPSIPSFSPKLTHTPEFTPDPIPFWSNFETPNDIFYPLRLVLTVGVVRQDFYTLSFEVHDI